MKRMVRWLGAIGLVIGLAGCGGGGDGGDGGGRPEDTPVFNVDSAGAVVAGPDGSRVDVPADAVTAPVRVSIAKDATAAPGLAADSGFRLVSNIFTITPHGQSFAKPVAVTLPLDTSRLTAGGQLVLLKAQPGGEWVVHTAVTRNGGEATMTVRDFSVFALAQRSAEPFRFSLVVTGTTPELVVAYQFSGQRPLCSRGLAVQTVFRYERTTIWGERYTGAFGQTYWNRDVRTEMLDQQVLVVPGGMAGAVAGHKVTQPMLPASNVVRTDSSEYGQEWKPFVEGRVLCNGEVLDSGDAGTTLTPQTWTYRSENMPQLAAHTGPLALLEDIAPVRASVGVRSTSSAMVQLRSDLWSQSLLQNSRWMLSRDAGATWAALASADLVEPAPPPAASGQTGTVTTNGQFRLGATLPELPLSYNGALIRLSACIDASLGSPACAMGAPRALSVSAATVAPAFSREPVSTLVVAGGSATFTAAATGTPPPDLQWQRAGNGGWVDIAGATGTSYSLPSATADDDGAQFRVVATNSAGSLPSGAATLNVVDQAAAPRVIAQSGSLTVAAGGSAVFAAQVTGTAPLSYQWRRNGTPITGANRPILRLDGVGDAQAGSYTLEVSNPAGTVEGAAQVLTVTPEGTAPATAPTITKSPTSVSVTEGNGATFGVGVAGSGPISFQWRKNGTNIPGATSATYTLAAVALADGGSYSVFVSNAAGEDVSAAATLTVLEAPPTPPPAQAPSIVTHPGTVVVAAGMGATLAVTVAGTGPFTYEWRRNGQVVAGQTSAVYTIAAASSLDVGTYVVRVTNAVGTANSNAGEVLLLGAPGITVPPGATSAMEGSTAGFSVTASGTGLLYQWSHNGVAIGGATAATYTTPALTLADNGAVYAVTVYNGAGLVTSGGATLTVSAAPVGAEWRAPSTLLASGSSFQPSAGIDDAGTAHAVWHAGNRTFASLGTGAGGWSEALPIDGGTLLNGYESRLAVSGGGKAVAVWGYQAGSAYRLAAAVFDGTAWLAPQRIDDSLSGNSDSARVAIDASGRAVAVWAQATTGGYVVMGRIFNGTTWSPVAPLDTGVTGGSPAVAVNAAGQGFVVFKRDSGELRALAVDTASGFGSATSLRAAGSSSGMLRVAIDGSGNAWAVWIDSATVGWDLVARRYTPAGGWAATTTLSTNVGFPLDDRFTVAGGSGGHLIVAWTDTNGAIVAMRWAPASGWSSDTLSTAGRAYAQVPTAAVNASGQISFVWLQADATDSRAEVVARTFDGSAWGAPVPLQASTLDISSTDQMGTGIASDGTAVAVWVEYASSGTEPVLGAFRR
jgi:hypothetical protein